MFKYLPSSALIYLPLSALPLETAKAVWFAISVIALVWTIRVVRELVPAGGMRIEWILPLLILAKYYLHELRLGQINILVTLVMLVSIRALARPRTSPRDLESGIAAGAAVALKPYAALVLPYFVLKREWRGLLMASAILVALLAVPAVFYGFEGNVTALRQWASTLSESTPSLLTNNDNVSIAAFFAKWMGPSTQAVVASGLILAALALLMLSIVVRGDGTTRAHVLEGALLLTLIPLASPLGWDYTFLMSLLAVALILNHFSRFPKPARVLLGANFAVIALAVYDILGRQTYATFMQWSITTVNFLIVVGALAWLRFRKHA
jgi:hypothetical protein